MCTNVNKWKNADIYKQLVTYLKKKCQQIQLSLTIIKTELILNQSKTNCCPRTKISSNSKS